MINKVLELKRLIEDNPKTKRHEQIKLVGTRFFNYLVDAGVLLKIGSTKSSSWYWEGDMPPYNLIENFYRPSKKTEPPVVFKSLFDVVLKDYEVSLDINKHVKVIFIDMNRVLLRRENGKEVIVTDANKLMEILSLLN